MSKQASLPPFYPCVASYVAWRDVAALHEFSQIKTIVLNRG